MPIQNDDQAFTSVGDAITRIVNYILRRVPLRNQTHSLPPREVHSVLTPIVVARTEAHSAPMIPDFEPEQEVFDVDTHVVDRRLELVRGVGTFAYEFFPEILSVLGAAASLAVGPPGRRWTFRLKTHRNRTPRPGRRQR